MVDIAGMGKLYYLKIQTHTVLYFVFLKYSRIFFVSKLKWPLLYLDISEH